MNALAQKIDRAEIDMSPVVITIGRRAFLRALESILPAIEKRNCIPLLGCALVEIADNRLRLTGTNMDQFLIAEMDLVSEASLQFALLYPQSVAALLKKITADEIEISLVSQPKDVQLFTITSGSVRAEFPTMYAGDMPRAPSLPTDASLDMQFGGKQLLEAIDRVAFAISKEETRYYLNGIYMHARFDADCIGTPWLIATDGHRLSLTRIAPDLDLPIVQCGEGPWGHIIPKEAIPSLAALAKRGAVSVSIWGQDTGGKTKDGLPVIRWWFAARSGDLTLFTKTIDGTFPDYGRVIPQNNEHTATIPPELLCSALGRVIIGSHERSKGCKIEITKDAIKLQVRSAMGTAVSESIALPSESVGPACEHGLNARYLSELMRKFSGAVTYRWKDATSPIVIYSADALSQGEASHLVVQMPMRV